MSSQRDAGLDADLLERAVAAVAVQEVRLSEVGHVEVRVAVVVVVERQCAERFTFLAADARARGGVLERAVAAVAVQMVAVAARDEEIGPAVPVEVEHGDARRQVLARDRDVPVGVRQERIVDVREPRAGRTFFEERGVRRRREPARPPNLTPSATRRRPRERAGGGAFRLPGAVARPGRGPTGTCRGRSRGVRRGAGSRRWSSPRGRATRIRRGSPRDGPPARPHRIRGPAGRGTGTRRSTGRGRRDGGEPVAWKRPAPGETRRKQFRRDRPGLPALEQRRGIQGCPVRVILQGRHRPAPGSAGRGEQQRGRQESGDRRRPHRQNYNARHSAVTARAAPRAHRPPGPHLLLRLHARGALPIPPTATTRAARRVGEGGDFLTSPHRVAGLRRRAGARLRGRGRRDGRPRRTWWRWGRGTAASLEDFALALRPDRSRSSTSACT